MQPLTRKQLILLVLLTLVWGLNWPVMKFGVTEFPALSFRAVSMLIGLPLLGLVLIVLRVPFRVPRERWGELLVLTVLNMLVWHVLIIIAVQSLSSGRAAILGYTMPIFSAVLGALYFGNRMRPRAWGGVAAAGIGVTLLLWHEFTNLAGRPVGVVLALTAAAVWAVGTQLLRRSTLPVPTLTITFWMTAITTLCMSTLSLVFERPQWKAPSPAVWATIIYNAVMIFVFAQAAWYYLARSLPPVASTLSVMFIPVLGVFSGALWLGEVLHWQDWTAVALMVVAIASVLLPAKAQPSRKT